MSGSLMETMLEGVSDKQLCELAQEGDRSALGEILRRHSGRLYRMLMSRLGSPTAAEEALAAAYIEVLESFHRFKWTDSGVYPWLHVVTLRVAYHAIRKAKRETLCAPADMLSEIDRVEHTPDRRSSDADVAYEYRETKHYVERALRRMRAADVDVVHMSVLEGKSRQACADELGIKLGTFDVRLHRALGRLRAELNALWDTGSEALVVAVVDERGGDVRHYMFNRLEVDIGRGLENELVLAHDDVSRVHARLLVRGDKFTVEDLGSTNGTYVNDAKIGKTTELGEADELRMGPFRLRAHRVADEEDRVAISSAARSVFVSQAAQATVFSGNERSPDSFAVKTTHAFSGDPELAAEEQEQVEALLKARRARSDEDGLERALNVAWNNDDTETVAPDFNAELFDKLKLTGFPASGARRSGDPATTTPPTSAPPHQPPKPEGTASK